MKQKKTFARVDGECQPDQPLTAPVNEMTPATVSPDQVSNEDIAEWAGYPLTWGDEG